MTTLADQSQMNPGLMIPEAGNPETQAQLEQHCQIQEQNDDDDELWLLTTPENSSDSRELWELKFSHLKVLRLKNTAVDLCSKHFR